MKIVVFHSDATKNITKGPVNNKPARVGASTTQVLTHLVQNDKHKYTKNIVLEY